MRRRHVIHLLVVPLAWAALTLGSVYVHSKAWSPDGDAASQASLIGEHAAKLLSNISQIATLPGWLFVWLKLRWYESNGAALVASGIGWFCWILAIELALLLRRVLRVRRSAPQPPAAPSHGSPAEASPDDADLARHDTATRRRFLIDATMCSAALAAIGTGGVSTATTPWSLRVRRYRVPIRGLPRELDGLKIVQISDTHLGPRIPASFIREAVELSLSLKPHLFVLTGDYIHMGRSHISLAAELFAPLTRPGASEFGVLGVLGNHDHYGDASQIHAALERVGVRMIDNARVFISGPGRRLSGALPSEACLCIAGLADLLEARVDVDAALHGIPADVPRVVLAHNPDTAEIPEIAGPPTSGARPRIDLMLSGHTHGGQVRLPLVGAPGVPSLYGQKYAQGLVQGPACPVIISTGIGMSLLPIRFGVPPEIVEITLEAASS